MNQFVYHSQISILKAENILKDCPQAMEIDSEPFFEAAAEPSVEVAAETAQESQAEVEAKFAKSASSPVLKSSLKKPKRSAQVKSDKSSPDSLELAPLASKSAHQAEAQPLAAAQQEAQAEADDTPMQDAASDHAPSNQAAPMDTQEESKDTEESKPSSSVVRFDDKLSSEARMISQTDDSTDGHSGNFERTVPWPPG